MDATTKVLKASTLKNKWQQTKAGLRHLLSDKALLPKFCCGNHIEVSRLFKKWQAEDLQNKPCKPFLLPEDIELYCMIVIWEIMHAANCSQAAEVKLLYALILRINSGGMVRHKHMEPMTWNGSIAKCSHVNGLDCESIYSLTCVPTKLLIKTAGPVEFFLVDDISNFLMHQWYTLFSPSSGGGNIDHVFLFPAISKRGEFNFQTPFTYENHKSACIDCVETLGLPVAPAVKKLYSSNSVRRGVAATLGQTMHNVLRHHNKSFGRVVNSRIDLDVYCPDDVLQSSGPLFGDVEEINHKLKTFVFDQTGSLHLKCDTCGFPNCTCDACIACNASREKGTKTKAKTHHTCSLLQYISSKGGAPPKHGYYDEDGKAALTRAWLPFGVDPPVFCKQGVSSGYVWQE